MIITLLLYWLAHFYADLAGERLRSGARLPARGLLATMLRERPILLGAAIPLATLLICWIAGTGLSAAVLAAVWTSAGIILAIELAAGLRGRLRGRQLVSQPFVGALLGSRIILLSGCSTGPERRSWPGNGFACRSFTTHTTPRPASPDVRPAVTRRACRAVL